MNKGILIHYDEIGLKGGNRIVFENKLIKNIKEKIKNNCFKGQFAVKRRYGHIIIEGIEHIDDNKWSELLSTCFGVSHFSFVFKTDNEIESIKKTVLELAKNAKFKNFRISARRSNKKFELSSDKMAILLGDLVRIKLNKKVNLKNHDLEIFVEVTEIETYVYSNKIQGPGGLPSGIGAKVVSLISGGIDSPVATWYMQKRGLETVLVHFHSKPFTNEASLQKIREIVSSLTKYNTPLKLYMCPFGDLQKQLLYIVPEDYRIIFYRRIMFLIAQEIALKENAKALVTGDAIGQVASQTMDNIKAVENVVAIPVLRPLCGFDKKEIIDKAKKIGTFESSILPHKDCCSMFQPVHPQTKADIDIIKEIEKKMDINSMIDMVLSKTEIEHIL